MIYLLIICLAHLPVSFYCLQSELNDIRLDLTVAHFLELALHALDEIMESDSDDTSSSSSQSLTSSSGLSTLSDSLFSVFLSSDTTGLATTSPKFIEFNSAISALHDEVSRSRTLFSRPRASCAPQLHLLEEWALTHHEKFRRKLRMDPEVFVEIVNRISTHPIFYNNSNNPQLAVPVQLAIFLNGIGHYGNAATPNDIAEWAGVSVGTVYNCYKRVMIAILHHHDNLMFFDPLDPLDQADRERAKCWVEARTCKEWRGGFLCVDGTPFNLFQKPGWHGEGFFDRKSNYSLSAQVCHHSKLITMLTSVSRSLFCHIIYAS